jgi:hypothetical protein
MLRRRRFVTRIQWIILASVVLGTATPALADSDAQLWLTVAGDVRVGPRTQLTGDVVIRSQPDSVEIAQGIYRVGIRRAVGGGWAVQLTYGLVESRVPGGRDRWEHRLGQVVTRPLGALGRLRFDGRIGTEQRLPSAGGEVGWRLRGRLRGVRSVGPGVDVQLSDELIGSLNDTGWGQRAGLTANRAAAGVRVALSPRVGVSPSYSWQHIFIDGRPDRNDHVAGLTLDAHF